MANIYRVYDGKDQIGTLAPYVQTKGIFRQSKTRLWEFDSEDYSDVAYRVWNTWNEARQSMSLRGYRLVKMDVS